VLHVSQFCVNNIFALSLLQFILKKFASRPILQKLFYERVQVPNQSLVSIVKWHITSPASTTKMLSAFIILQISEMYVKLNISK